jgi:hypothetical protein
MQGENALLFLSLYSPPVSPDRVTARAWERRDSGVLL